MVKYKVLKCHDRTLRVSFGTNIPPPRALERVDYWLGALAPFFDTIRVNVTSKDDGLLLRVTVDRSITFHEELLPCC